MPSVVFSSLRIKKKRSSFRSKYSLITTINSKYEKGNYLVDLQKTGELRKTEVKLAYPKVRGFVFKNRYQDRK